MMLPKSKQYLPMWRVIPLETMTVLMKNKDMFPAMHPGAMRLMGLILISITVDLTMDITAITVIGILTSTILFIRLITDGDQVDGGLV